VPFHRVEGCSRAGPLPRRKAGGRKRIETTRVRYFSRVVPDDLGQAWAQYALDTRKRRTDVARELLESLLVEQGYLRIHRKKDPDTGHEVIVYEALRPREPR
jgi:hypothetical protein